MDENGVAGWLIGIAIAVVTAIGGIIVRDRQILELIREGDDALADRLNETRDDFVRKDDLDRHIQRIERSIDEIKVDMREQRRANERVDAALQIIASAVQKLTPDK